jgi:hypothetical protein
VTREGYLTDILADEAIAELQRSVGGQPFFLSLHFNAPHWPWEGPGDRARSASLTSLRDEAGGSIVTYAAMVAAMDAAVARVLAALADLGLEDNTMVVFTRVRRARARPGLVPAVCRSRRVDPPDGQGRLPHPGLRDLRRRDRAPDPRRALGGLRLGGRCHGHRPHLEVGEQGLVDGLSGLLVASSRPPTKIELSGTANT